MIINQLFVNLPSNEILVKIIKAFGLNDINDIREFSQIDMIKNNTIEILQKMDSELRDLYIPCKQYAYIDNLKLIENKYILAITIFRQFLKAYNYDLYSKQKFIKGVKYLVYKIVSKEYKKNIKVELDNKKKKKKIQNQEIIIVFD